MARGGTNKNAFELPVSVRDEIVAVSERTHRSIAFIVRRALAAAGPAAHEAQGLFDGDRATLLLTTDDDDPADTLAKIRAAVGTAPLGDRVASAWLTTRERFLSWAAREESARGAERADELDEGLRDAAAASTSGGRLAELARSGYPRVRALVAAHASVEVDTLGKLADDREKVVRAAVAANPRTPPELRAKISLD